MFRQYYTLTKPGIIYGNVMTAAGAFLLASKGHVDVWLGIATLVGIGLIIGSACVFNNYTDRDIDKKMARTKKRALAHGDIPTLHALVYGAVLGVIGFGLLAVYANTRLQWCWVWLRW
jgi:heme o synthase